MPSSRLTSASEACDRCIAALSACLVVALWAEMHQSEQMQTTQGDRPFVSPGFWLAAMAGALLSLLVSGFSFPQNNNIFHLPIVGALYDRPQFSDDVFIQSLRHFSSGIWLLLEGADRWIALDPLFLVLLFASRLLSVLGFLACADHFGIKSLGQRLAFAALIALSPFMTATSIAGGGGLFLDYFTHSEIANGLFLLGVFALIRGRLALSLSLTGLTFFVNAFFGVWLGFVLAVVLGLDLARGRLTLRQILVPGTAGLVAAGILAAPVLWNILSNPTFGAAIDFDFVAYLEQYYPYHFLIWVQPLRALVTLAALALVAALALIQLRAPDPRPMAVLSACLGLYALGIVAPFVTHSPAVMNLHLLRSGVTIHLLATLFLSILLVRWWASSQVLPTVAAVAITVSMILSLRLPFYTITLALACLALVGVWIASRGQPGGNFLPPRIRQTMALACLVLAVGSLGLRLLWLQETTAPKRALQAEWEALADWARRSTDVAAVFMAPEGGVSADFEYNAQRGVWVDWKRGAAVMWSPPYHGMWKERLEATAALWTLADKEAYARRNGIGYILATPSGLCEGRAVFATSQLCVVKVE